MSTNKIDDYTASTHATAEDVQALPRLPLTPVMAEDAYHGLAGEIVRVIVPYSEADPVAILMNVLISVGNMLGRGPHALVERTAHYTNDYLVLVGRSSKARKGQSWSTPRWLLGQVDEPWITGRVRSGLSSGEGLIYHVRDPREEMQPVKERGRVIDYQRVVVDEGETDKRLLAFEAEFATVLRRMQGDTNSLSAVLRDAWDTGNLSTLTKNSPLRATGAHVSVIAHTTREELVASLTEIDRVNGFGNRFLYMMVERSKYLPETIPLPGAAIVPFIERVGMVVAAAQPLVVERDPEARALWAAVYPSLSEGEGGLIGAILARAEAHVLRLSVLYAALDRSPRIRPEHLRAALAVWDYAETSARRIFGEAIGLSVPHVILTALRSRGPMTRDEIRDLFHRNKSSAEIDAALGLLQEKSKARCATRPPEGGKGRAATVWEATWAAG